jgi:DNA polymerase-3 subunit beta
VKIPSDVLVNAFNKTLFATGNDELRPVMAGVFCTLAPDSATFVATDAHKLVRYTRADVKSEANISFILPKKPINLLKNVLPQDKEQVTLQYSQKNAVFVFDNLVLSCKLVDGKYPNYDAVIPVDNPHKMSVDRLSLYNSIKRVSIYANQSTHQIRFKIQGQELVLSAEDLDYSNAANERLACNYTGEDMEIGFNSRFLLEMLSNMDTDEITVEMSAPNRAGLIVPVDGENAAEDILMLIMPVMLN